MIECTLLCETHGELVSGGYGADDDPETTGLVSTARTLHLARFPACRLSIFREASDDAIVWRLVAEIEQERADAERHAAQLERYERERERIRRLQEHQEAATPVAEEAPSSGLAVTRAMRGRRR